MGSVVTVMFALAVVAGNILYWHRVVTRGDDVVRRRVEQRYGVTIVRGHRGHWRVTSSTAPRRVYVFIEMLQLVYFLGAMLVWALGIVVALGVFMLAERLFA